MKHPVGPLRFRCLLLRQKRETLRHGDTKARKETIRNRFDSVSVPKHMLRRADVPCSEVTQEMEVQADLLAVVCCVCSPTVQRGGADIALNTDAWRAFAIGLDKLASQ